ncbi:DUF58 domain-containing protein [Gammaproteobacteria bacterium]
MRRSLRSRLREAKLFQGKEGSGLGPTVLTRHTVYILPSRDGLLYAALVITMLVGSLNYANAMGLALTFVLTGLGLVTMVHTYRNLVGITVQPGRVEPIFAGQEAAFQICLSETAGRLRPAINLYASEGPLVTTDLPADRSGDCCVTLHRFAPQRGRLPLGRIHISTFYPLGLFRAWGVVHFDVTCLVYPTPASPSWVQPPAREDSTTEGQIQAGRGVDDFAGFRSYQPGDPLRRFHWRAFARERGLHTTIFAGKTHQELRLDWDILTGMSSEDRLSQLCRWVLEADVCGLRYGLHLPNSETLPDHGDEHRHRCLEVLALYPNALPLPFRKTG